MCEIVAETPRYLPYHIGALKWGGNIVSSVLTLLIPVIYDGSSKKYELVSQQYRYISIHHLHINANSGHKCVNTWGHCAGHR